MKKTALFLALALTAALCACGQQPGPTAEGGPAVVSASPVPPSAAPDSGREDPGAAEKAREELEELLRGIEENVPVGTAGAFMAAVPWAVSLMDWGTGTELDSEGVKRVAAAWLEDKDGDGQAAFAGQMAQVDAACQRLTEEGAEDLLESAGCPTAAYPYEGVPEAVEALMEAVGLR